jgi:hypothetical protein
VLYAPRALDEPSPPGWHAPIDITDAQLSWLMGCAFLLALVLGWPALTTAIGLGEYRVLGQLYRHVKNRAGPIREAQIGSDCYALRTQSLCLAPAAPVHDERHATKCDTCRIP